MSSPDQTVLTMGVFDVLHKGHEAHLGFCRTLGSAVVVGLWPDTMVNRMKGPGRPHNTAETRRANILDFCGVASVFISSDYPDRESGIRAAAEMIKPTFIAVSDDRDFVEGQSIGRSIVRLDPSYALKEESTTRILEALSDNQAGAF